MSETTTLRIEWGSIFIYSPLPTHNLHFNWDGRLDVENGRLTQLELIEFWGSFGPSREKTTELSGQSWKSAVTPGSFWNFEGVLASVEAEVGCAFRLVLGEDSHEFTLDALNRAGKLVFPCGPKYSAVNIVVSCDRQSKVDACAGTVAGPSDFQGAESVREFYRTPYAWIAPGTKAEVVFDQAPECGDRMRGRVKAMICDPEGGDSREEVLWHELPFRIRFNGEEVRASKTLFEHFRDCQLVKELEFDLSASSFSAAGNHLEIENLDDRVYLLLNRVVLEPADPKASSRLHTGPEILRETILTGIDMGTAAPENGEIDHLLAEMVRRDMGRYVLFRTEIHHADEADWTRWFQFCRAHGIVFSLYEIQKDPLIYAQTPMNDRLGVETKIRLAREHGGECFLGVHHHERSNLAYGWGEAEPLELRRTRSMKDAAGAFVRRMQDDFDFDNAPRIHGEAAPLFHYNYAAGVDVCMAETQTGNTTYLLAAARGAAAVYNKGDWGIHVACHLHKQPQDETDGIIWGLNLCLGYLHGARYVYDEEALYVMFHGNHQSYFDPLTRDRQERMITFQRFAAENPRRGVSRVRFGLLQGNYSCITGGLNVGETPVKVWGSLGAESESWSYGPPESGWRLADVFLPGLFLAPIPVDRSRMRRWMSGTPHGPCDVLPANAAVDVLESYSCLFLWDWNSMTSEIYDNLRAYVEAGGTLFLGLPQLSTHVHREFLNDMEDLALLHGGDFSDFLGFRVQGRAEAVREIEYSGRRFHIQNDTKEPEIRNSELEVTSTDVRVLAKCDDGRPALLARRCGRGEVISCALWNYAGSEALLEFSTAVVDSLALAHRGDLVVEGKDSIHWACYEDAGERVLYLVDTDWTAEGRGSECTVNWGERSQSVTVTHDRVSVVKVS